MPFDSPLALLDSLLIGELLDPADLDSFIADHSKEGLHHDFKDGAELEKPKPKPANTIREYLAGFANSDGGILIVGVSESDPRKVTGAKAPGGGALDDWAHSTIVGISSHFSIQPRFQVVPHDEGEVLICATARSSQLVPVIESREWKHFLRTHHSTIEAPPYLVSDLVLGRRNHPVLRLRLEGVTVVGHQAVGDSSGKSVALLPLDITFTVENLSLAPADDVLIGIVSWEPTEFGTESAVSERLQYYIEQDAPEQPSMGQLRWTLRHSNSMDPSQLSIPTFGYGATKVRRGLLVPNIPALDPVAYAAVYVLSKSAPPSWYQLACETALSAGEQNKEKNARRCRLTEAMRPRVGWKRIDSVG